MQPVSSIIHGQKVQNFRIIDRLGQGGMGEVFVAHDERLERKVALKSIRPERRLDAKVKARFMREAKILSQLAHPNICQIFEYIEEDDHDFLVLELIAGQNLAQAMEEGLDKKQKLAIAIDIAHALVAAHERGIVHRDIKPENVMFGEKGEVKVLDFGLSRSLPEEENRVLSGLAERGELQPGDLEVREALVSQTQLCDDNPGNKALTEMGTILGTVGYMSPEQALGEDSTTASDIYSLGLLYHLLFIEETPYEMGASLASQLLTVSEAKTKPASGIDQDLATLIDEMKSKAPALRPTAAALVKRMNWIQTKPQRQRRRALAIVAVLVLSVFSLITTMQAIRISKEQARVIVALDEAEQARDEAEEVVEFIEGMFAVSKPGEALGNTITVRQVLDDGAERINRELQEQPLTQARLMDTIGTVYSHLGLYNQAEPLLNRALETREEAFGPDHLKVSESLLHIGVYYQAAGRYEESEGTLLRAVAIRESTLGPNDPDVAEILIELATLHYSQGRYEESENLHRRALTIDEQSLGAKHPRVAKSLHNLALLYSDQGKYDDAEALFNRALAIEEKVLATNHPEFALTLHNLAALYYSSGQYEKAEEVGRRALQIQEKVLGPEHSEVATSLSNLGLMCSSRGDYGQAEALYRRALTIQEKVLDPNHPDIATSLNNIATLFYHQKRFADAEPLFKQALVIEEGTLGPDHPDVAISVNNLATLYFRLERYEESEQLFLRALAIKEKALGPDHSDIAYSLRGLARVYTRQRRYAEAETLFLRALKIHRDALGSDHEKVAQTAGFYAELLRAMGRNDEAKKLKTGAE